MILRSPSYLNSETQPMKTKLLIILSLALAMNAYAGSATWNLNPATNDWNTATNWTPATVPNSPTDIATLDASNTTSILSSADVDLASLIFTADAPSYSIATDRKRTLTFWDEGVRNDSGVQQTFTGGFTFNGDQARATMSVMGSAAFPLAIPQPLGALHLTTPGSIFSITRARRMGFLPTPLSPSTTIRRQETARSLRAEERGMEPGASRSSIRPAREARTSLFPRTVSLSTCGEAPSVTLR
jgi:hypothetical protein